MFCKNSQQHSHFGSLISGHKMCYYDALLAIVSAVGAELKLTINNYEISSHTFRITVTNKLFFY